MIDFQYVVSHTYTHTANTVHTEKKETQVRGNPAFTKNNTLNYHASTNLGDER